MWDNHPFSECNKITKRTVGVEVEGDKEGGKGVGQNFKRRGEVYAIYGGLQKIGGSSPLCQLCVRLECWNHAAKHKEKS